MQLLHVGVKKPYPCIHFDPNSSSHHLRALHFVLDETTNSTSILSMLLLILLISAILPVSPLSCKLRNPRLLSHFLCRSHSLDTYILRIGFPHPPVSFFLFGFYSQLSRCIISFVMWWQSTNPALLVSRVQKHLSGAAKNVSALSTDNPYSYSLQQIRLPGWSITAVVVFPPHTWCFAQSLF